MNQETHIRLCPICEKEIIHINKKSYSRACKKNSKCSSCRIRGRKLSEKHKAFLGELRRGTTLSEEHKEKISVGIKKAIEEDRFFSMEHRARISASKQGKKFSKEHKASLSDARKKYYAKYGCSGEIRKKLRISRVKQREEALKNNNQLHPSYNPRSIPIIEEYGKEHDFTFQHAENGGEFHIKELGYWVDGYDAEKNVVIEYYESHHKRQVKKDTTRREEIENYLGCEFIVIKEEEAE